MPDPRRRLREPEAWVLALFATAALVGFTWGLPGCDSWSTDSISPRSCGLGAIVETYWPGHFHTYPPLHMALLTVLSLPWILLAAARVGTNMDVLGDELVKPLYMTGIEASARLVALIMGLAIVWNTMRLWTRLAGRRAGILAGLVVATLAPLVYYTHTGNLEVPYLFWITWCLVEMDRVASGEPREGQALLFAAAAALTKDQAVAAFLLPLPVYLVLVPRLARGTPILRWSLVRGILLAALVYAVGSGALPNPTGFGRRVAFLLGPASETWAGYPRSLPGMVALARDALRAIPRFTSLPLAAFATLGVIIASTSKSALDRSRALLPLATAVSFALFFNLGARRAEERFLLPQSVLFFPYAALVLDRALGDHGLRRAAAILVAVLAFVPAVLGVASMDATLLVDPRYAAERFLAALPAGSRVEVYGGPIFLPRIPSRLRAVRPGIEPVSERQRIPDVAELVDPAMDLRPRAPDIVVLETELSTIDATEVRGPHPYGLMQYRDPVSSALFRGLLDGSLGYERVLRATCSLPWPLECRSIHHATAGEAWIYARR